MIRDEIKEQQDKLKDKSPLEKFKYFFYYYKYHVLIVVAVVYFLIYTITSIVQNSREASIYVALLNTSLTSLDEITLMDDYVQSRSIDINANPAVLDTSISLDEKISTDTGLANFQKVMSLLDIGELDILMCPETWLIDEYAGLDAYANLEELLPADLFEKVKHNLYYVKNSVGEEIPVAFYLNDNPKIVQANIYPEDVNPLLAISSTSLHKERAVDFIRYLFE